MTGLPAIIAALEPAGDGWRGPIPASWMQGRTAYGGLSSALALVAAQRVDHDLPPLRSAQVAFIGPLSGLVCITARRLRRGRNAVWVQADVESEAGLGLRATFVFMAEQPSRIDLRATRPFDVADPCAIAISGGVPPVAFTQHFEFADPAAAVPNPAPAEWLRWVRLRERIGLHPAVELVAVADCLPPAALKLADGAVPVSSMTWQLDLLGSGATHDGWHLLRAATDHVAAGVSSQRMTIWDGAGHAIARQSQSVALFG